MGLVHQDILKPEEISEENVQIAVKAFMATNVKLNQILAARYKGDYTLEKILCPPAAPNSDARLENDRPSSDDAPEVLLSQLINRYVETNINDCKWEKRTVADHRNRVSTLLSIIGDKAITRITRDDIRQCRDMLRKLPPNWKKLLAKTSLSPADIIENNKKGDLL
ncbi:MAG: hypothetical protein HDQ44_02130, partial [Desulfovibrio sp.]|nr:hypothetical protein [Desulfovibrio sp.]